MSRLSRPVYISITDAAALISVSPRTISRYIEDGHLAAGQLPHGQQRVQRAQVLGLIRTTTARNPL